MTFQFQCPQGHLLQGEEMHVGQQSQCPMCGAFFIIPAPVTAVDAAYSFETPTAHDEQPAISSVPSPFESQQEMEEVDDSPDSTEEEDSQEDKRRSEAETIDVGEGKEAPQEEPPILHILCPNGHELETPREMLDQDAICPECEIQFPLREKDSIEYKEKQAEKRKLREERANTLWLKASVGIAIAVVLGLIVLMIVSSLE